MKRKPPFKRRPGAAAVTKHAPDHGPRPDTTSPEPVRLQKVLASAGVGSRRHCESLIASGRVEVDGKVTTELGTKVLPHQAIRVDGVSVARMRHVYFLVNKPAGVVSTNFDPSGRPRVVDLLPPIAERLFTIGRLDMSSEGLILVTNDGELANHLAHPRYGVEKTYQVQVAGQPDLEVLNTLRRGVHLAEGLARVDGVRVKRALKQSTLLEIVLSEGKNREIRRVLAKVGHKVLRLKRIAIGPLRLGDLPVGEFRRLTTEEVRALRDGRPRRHSSPAKSKGRGARPRRPKSGSAAATQERPRSGAAVKPRGAAAKRSTQPVQNKRYSRDVESTLIVRRRRGVEELPE